MGRNRYDEELLRSIVSGLGTVEEDEETGARVYKKGYDCSGCLDDMRRLLHRDDAEKRQYFKTLGKWDVVKTDLVPLLNAYPGDTQLVFSALKVLVYLTMPLEASSEDTNRQRQYLQSFKSSVLEGNVLAVMVGIVAEPLSAHPDMGEEDARTIQLVLTFFRNILRIADPSPSLASGSYHMTRMRLDLLNRFFDENIMELLLLCAQYSDAPPFDEEGLLLLEIFDELLRGIDATTLVRIAEGDSGGDEDTSEKENLESSRPVTTTLGKIREEQMQRKAASLLAPLRHSRFSGMYSKVFGDGQRSLARRDHRHPPAPAAVMKPKAYSKAKKPEIKNDDVIDEPEDKQLAHKIQQHKAKPTGPGMGDINGLLSLDKVLAGKLNGFCSQFVRDAFNIMMPPLMEDDLRELPGIFEEDGNKGHLRLMRYSKFIISYFRSRREQQLRRKPGLDDMDSDEEDRLLTYADVSGLVSLKGVMYTLRLWNHCADVPPVSDEKDWVLQDSSIGLLMEMLLVLKQVLEDGAEEDIRVVEVWIHKLLYDMTEAGILPQLHRGLKNFNRDKQPRSALVDLVFSRQVALSLLESIHNSTSGAYGGLQVLRKKRVVKRKPKKVDGDAELKSLMNGKGEDNVPEQNVTNKSVTPTEGPSVDHQGDIEERENDGDATMKGAEDDDLKLNAQKETISDKSLVASKGADADQSVKDVDGENVVQSVAVDEPPPPKEEAAEPGENTEKVISAAPDERLEEKGPEEEEDVRDPKATPEDDAAAANATADEIAGEALESNPAKGAEADEIEEEAEEDTPQVAFVERVLDLRKEKIKMIDKKFVSHLAWLLRAYKTNRPSLNECIANAIVEILYPEPRGLDLAPMVWQLSMLHTCYEILTDRLLRSRKSPADNKLLHLATKVTRTFLEYLVPERTKDLSDALYEQRVAAGKMMFVEVLFPKGRRRALELKNLVEKPPEPVIRKIQSSHLGDDEGADFPERDYKPVATAEKKKRGRGLLSPEELEMLGTLYDQHIEAEDPMAAILESLGGDFTRPQIRRQLQKIGKDTRALRKRRKNSMAIKGVPLPRYSGSEDDSSESESDDQDDVLDQFLEGDDNVEGAAEAEKGDVVVGGQTLPTNVTKPLDADRPPKGPKRRRVQKKVRDKSKTLDDEMSMEEMEDEMEEMETSQPLPTKIPTFFPSETQTASPANLTSLEDKVARVVPPSSQHRAVRVLDSDSE